MLVRGLRNRGDFGQRPKKRVASPEQHAAPHVPNRYVHIGREDDVEVTLGAFKAARRNLESTPIFSGNTEREPFAVESLGFPQIVTASEGERQPGFRRSVFGPRYRIQERARVESPKRK